MKATLTCLTFLCAFGFLSAQISNIQNPLSVNESGDDPHATAVLDVSADEKGILIPRMTTAKRNAILDPANGLIVYDSTANQICHYSVDHWECLPAPNSCPTLDDAYDCGVPGGGRTVQVDAGAVYLDGDEATTTLQAENEGTGSVATFRDQLAGGVGTESLVTIGQHNGDALYAEMFGGSTSAVHGWHTGLGRAGFFELPSQGGMGFTALEGFHHGTKYGVFGHTGLKDTVEGNYNLFQLPIGGVLGLASDKNITDRDGVVGVSLGDDGTYGKSFAPASGISSATEPINIKAGVKGTMESTATSNGADYVGVIGTPAENGIGVIGTPGKANTTRGIGVFGVSGGYEATPSTNAGVWGVTREGRTWPALLTKFPYPDMVHNKVQVGVLGQSEKYIAVWGESLKNIGVLGTTSQQSAYGPFSSIEAGVMGVADTTGHGVIGHAKSEMNGFAGVLAHGRADREKASALHVHDGDIRVTKDVAMHTPADKVVVTPSWAEVLTCEEFSDPPHKHIQAYQSAPIVILNQYASVERSVIIVTVESPIPGATVQLTGVANGEFDVALMIHNPEQWCANGPPSSPFVIHYMIINK